MITNEKDFVFQALEEKIYRISGGEQLFFAYMVETSESLIQINSVPECFKTYFPYLSNWPEIICITKPICTPYGDSLTGLEFSFWAYLFLNSNREQKKIKVIGKKKYLTMFYNRFSATMNGDFISDDLDNDKVTFDNKKWIDDAVELIPIQDSYQTPNVTIVFNGEYDVEIIDKRKSIFDTTKYPQYRGDSFADSYLQGSLNNINVDNLYSNYPQGKNISVTVIGKGNGTNQTASSSFLIHNQHHKILLDTPARFQARLAHIGIHPDSITHYIISHYHEDHIEGFGGLLYDKVRKNQKIKLLTATSIYETMQTIFDPYFETGIAPYIEFIDIEDPDNKNIISSMEIETRRNYHTVPTLGFKFISNHYQVGISGDTLYEPIVLKRALQNGTISQADFDKLHHSWFEKCAFVFHDTCITFDKIHTQLKYVEELADKLAPIPIYAYHYFGNLLSYKVKPSYIGMTL